MVSRVGRIGSTVADRGIVLMGTRAHANSGAFVQILHQPYMCTAGPTAYYSSSVHIHPTSKPRPKAHNNNKAVKGI